MSISAVNAPPLLTPQLQSAVVSPASERGGTATDALSAGQETHQGRRTEVMAVAPADGGGTGERVSLSPDPERAAQQAAASVYAEVWKGGVKVAAIDSRGNVSAVGGLLMNLPGGSVGGGPELAARRAAQIAQTVGGEIRAGGQILDVQTLAIRAKVQAAYGVGFGA